MQCDVPNAGQLHTGPEPFVTFASVASYAAWLVALIDETGQMQLYPAQRLPA